MCVGAAGECRRGLVEPFLLETLDDWILYGTPTPRSYAD